LPFLPSGALGKQKRPTDASADRLMFGDTILPFDGDIPEIDPRLLMGTRSRFKKTNRVMSPQKAFEDALSLWSLRRDLVHRRLVRAALRVGLVVTLASLGLAPGDGRVLLRPRALVGFVVSRLAAFLSWHLILL
jgi:hypothetical protein